MRVREKTPIFFTKNNVFLEKPSIFIKLAPDLYIRGVNEYSKRIREKNIEDVINNDDTKTKK